MKHLLSTAIAVMAAVIVSCGNSLAQPEFPDPGQRIKLWNYGAVVQARGDVEFRLGVALFNFEKPVRNLTVFTNTIKFVFKSFGDDTLYAYGSSLDYTPLITPESNILIVRVTGEVDGEIYDLTGNVDVVAPPPPVKMTTYDRGSLPRLPCFPGRPGAAVFEGVLASVAGNGTYVFRLDSGQEIQAKAGQQGISWVDTANGLGKRFVVSLELRNSTDPDTRECRTEALIDDIYLLADILN